MNLDQNWTLTFLFISLTDLAKLFQEPTKIKYNCRNNVLQMLEQPKSVKVVNLIKALEYKVGPYGMLIS